MKEFINVILAILNFDEQNIEYKEPLKEEEGWTRENFYVCVHDGCYSMIRAKNAIAIQEGKANECRYCNKQVTAETLGSVAIKFKKQ